ncbi:type II toxin-antitoxin system Phd/YefM family antitoxin [Thalassospira marina]|uniref:Antitoxin n=1 Tax=Thalassospira marina TaxID=2048283 RepID=A0A2N3KRP4_9PROT|nr:type II toxin-antitoxin system Phd/YefM family antitoxin [Thalassospira marina]AUG53687.1 prevent-host-death protein [Thalassospira marina]PKR53222.1 prevent-host-death protein [Thalassospira marina]
MDISTFTAREFNQDTSKAKKASLRGPVFITDRGKPAHVLLSIEQYQKILGLAPSIVDLLAKPETADIDLKPQRIENMSDIADFE